MKKILKLLVVALLCIPFTVSAEEKFNIVAKDELSSEVNVVGSNVLLGNNVTSNDVVNGINMLFGNNVNHKANSDYAVVAGNNVNIFGNVNNDGFIFGNLILFDEGFIANRDLFVFGNTVTLKGKINRDVTIYASSVIVENLVVEGNMTINASTININSGEVKGVLSYNEDAVVEIGESANITDTKLLEKIVKEVSLKEKIVNFFVDYAGILVVFLVLALIIPKLFMRIENKYEEVKLFDLFSSLGFGALLLVFIPVLFILLLTTTIGVQASILLLIAYIVGVWLSNIFTGYLIGLLIWKKIIKKDINILLVGLVGISAISILQVIPYINVYVTIISLMVGLGVIFRLFKKD